MPKELRAEFEDLKRMQRKLQLVREKAFRFASYPLEDEDEFQKLFVIEQWLLGKTF